MYKTKLCLGTSESFGISTKEQIRLFKKVGFDGFFTGWSSGCDIALYRRIADEEGMIYQSIHAPFGNSAVMWKSYEEAKAAIDELLACVEDCGKFDVPIMICHPFIGFLDHNPTKEGIGNFKIVVEKAKSCGVKIAFENVEGEEYLEALMNAFSGYDNVGFCWDTGHEMCYNYHKDMMAKYGDRLIATHINDNLGISKASGEIFWTDDLHLLPFDGVGDWEGIAKRLVRHNYDGILTFELNRCNKPERMDNQKYINRPIEEYITEVYARACRVAVLKQRFEREKRNV